MNSSLLFIPEKIRIGFQHREDTYDGKLSYVIYYDEKGKIRKEASWNQWRDSSIAPLELENTPVSGLNINKSIRRDSYHFGSGRNMLRVYDPRGFEFEISIENLVGIIHFQDIIKGELQGEYVYAMSGKDLIVLPTNSPQYQQAVAHTLNKNTKVSARDFKPGQMYHTKGGQDVVYLGRFHFNEVGNYFFILNPRGKQHIFQCVKNSRLRPEYMALSASQLGQQFSELDEEVLHEAIETYTQNLLLSQDNLAFKGRPLPAQLSLSAFNNGKLVFCKPFNKGSELWQLVVVHGFSLVKIPNPKHPTVARPNNIGGMFHGHLPEDFWAQNSIEGPEVYMISCNFNVAVAQSRHLRDLGSYHRSLVKNPPMKNLLGKDFFFNHGYDSKTLSSDGNEKWFFSSQQEANNFLNEQLSSLLCNAFDSAGFQQLVWEDQNHRQFPAPFACAP